MEGDEEQPTLSPSQLLQLAETHLRLRNFTLSRQCALESHHPNDPLCHQNHRRASQLAAISDILLAAYAADGVTNWYAVLQLDTFCDNHDLIRTHFKKLLMLLDPIKDELPLANEALGFLWKAYNWVSNSTSKSQLDSQLAASFSNQNHVNGCGDGEGEGGGEGSFWTFCPYCFYVYEFARAFEGCCLRCQNESCKRAFHGVSLCSLPTMELDKGRYFSCSGYFPLGFSPAEFEKKGKFGSWSPIVGLFPVGENGKTYAGRVGDGDDGFVQMVDESEESESHIYDSEKNHEHGTRRNAGSNAVKHPEMRQKTVAWNAKKLMRRGKKGIQGGNDYEAMSNSDGHEDGEMSGFRNVHDAASKSGSALDSDKMKFYEEDGEIFLNLGPDETL